MDVLSAAPTPQIDYDRLAQAIVAAGVAAKIVVDAASVRTTDAGSIGHDQLSPEARCPADLSSAGLSTPGAAVLPAAAAGVDFNRADRSLAHWLAAFERHCSARIDLGELSAKTAGQVLSELRQLSKLAAWPSIETIDEPSLDHAIDELRLLRPGRRGHDHPGRRTLNHYLSSAKQFSRWLKRRKALPHDPLADVELPKVRESQLRFERGALSPDNFGTLYLATLAGPRRKKLTGVDRGHLYLCAAHTGFRRGELAELTPANFDSKTQQVMLPATASKRRRHEAQVLAEAVLSELCIWMADKPRNELLWPILHKTRTADMIAFDLHRAGIDRTDADGRVIDFHSLRSSYILFVQQTGASLKVAQTLARHSDPRLTYNTYGKHNVARELRDVAARMPAVPRQQHHYPLFAGLEAAW